MSIENLSQTGEKYRKEMFKLLEVAKSRNITLRVLGGLAIREHCPKFNYLLDKVGRQYADLDFATVEKDNRQLRLILTENGYEIDRQVLIAAEGMRYLFNNQKNGIDVDVFVDYLHFNHQIDLRSRIQVDDPTISLADLLLSKLQIVEISERDLWDTVVLILEHEFAESDKYETINVSYITTLLAEDWGFYHTVNQNFKLLKKFLSSNPHINDINQKTCSGRIEKLKERIQSEKKTLFWRLRSKIGTKVQWYKTVSERGSVF